MDVEKAGLGHKVSYFLRQHKNRNQPENFTPFLEVPLNQICYESTPKWIDKPMYKTAALRMISELINLDSEGDDNDYSQLLNKGLTLWGNVAKPEAVLERENGLEIILGLYALNILPPEMLCSYFKTESISPEAIAVYVTRYQERIFVARFLSGFVGTPQWHEEFAAYAIAWIQPLMNTNVQLLDFEFSKSFRSYMQDQYEVFKRSIFTEFTNELDRCTHGLKSSDIKEELQSSKGYANRKEREDVWVTLLKEPTHNRDEIAHLIKDWGENFPLKYLDKHLKSSPAVFLAALQSNQYGILVYLNRESESLLETLNYSNKDWEEIADGIAALYEDWRWNGIVCDLTKLWEAVIKNHWSNQWRMREHKVIAAAPNFENFAIDYSLLKCVPSSLLKAWTDRTLAMEQKSRDLLLRAITRNFLMDIELTPIGHSNSNVRDLSLEFQKTCFDLLEFERAVHGVLYTPMAIHLWLCGVIDAPSIENLNTNTFKDNFNRSLCHSPLPALPFTRENLKALELISGLLKKESDDWSEYWGQLVEQAQRKYDSNKEPTAKLWVGRASFREAWITQLADSFSSNENSDIGHEFENYLFETRIQNIGRLQKGTLTVQQAESLKNLARQGGNTAWSWIKINDALGEGALTPAQESKVYAELEAEFMPQLLYQSIVWVMRQKSIHLTLRSPWIGMRIFAQSFDDRPTVWARQILSVLQREDIEEREAVRLIFALGHLRESLGGAVPQEIARAKDRFDNVASIMTTQRQLFNGENLNKGHFKDAVKRVNSARMEVMKLQKGL